MDGGFRSWTRKIENNSPDLDDYGKPLPPPPSGFYWSRLADGSWEVLEFTPQEKKNRQSNDDDFITVESSSVFEHVVLPSDTLQGLSLRYGVSAVSLRQLNNFSGSAFRSQKVLRIPLEAGATIRVQRQSTREVLLQRFKNSSGEAEKEARFYLELHEWDLSKALADWSGDESWSLAHQQQQKQAVSAPPPPAPMSTDMNERSQQQDELQEEGEDTPLLTPLLNPPIAQSEKNVEGVRIVQPLEIVYATTAS